MVDSTIWPPAKVTMVPKRFSSDQPARCEAHTCGQNAVVRTGRTAALEVPQGDRARLDPRSAW